MAEQNFTQDFSPDRPGPASEPKQAEKAAEKSRGLIGTTFSGHEIEGELGRGGMGVVYRARQVKLNRTVALKMLTGHYGADELKRFLAEAETAARLQHANIVHIYEVGENEGVPFFSMEFVEGGSLADRLRKNGPPPVREAAALMMSVARALHFAHQNGVVHRDMKPGNVLMDSNDVPKVADFGIAKRLSDDSALTLSGAVIGTPAYMAPEQAKGTSRHVGPAADVYALGAMLYEMLTGRPPFLPDDSEEAITIREMSEVPVSPAYHCPQIPRDLETICMKCIEKEPRDRYISAAALAEDLRRFLDDEPILARPPTKLVTTMRWVRRHPWRIALGFAVLLLAVGAQKLWYWQYYVRTHVQYADTIDYVRGVIEPVKLVPKEEAERHPVSLRVTRRGRRGPVTMVEVMNARGHPAVMRLVGLAEPIPIYIEGITGSMPFMERMPETTKVEIFYVGDTVRELKGRDHTGTVNWRLIYDEASDDDSSSEAKARFVHGEEDAAAKGGKAPAKTVHARFANIRGSDRSSIVGKAAHIEFQRDSAGHDTLIRFFDSADGAAPNGEKTYGYRIERDGAGQITRLFNLGKDGSPAANREGLTALALTRASDGRIVRFEPLNAGGMPAALLGVSSMTWDYDSVGNAIRISRLDAQGKPLVSSAGEWSVQELGRNERGEITSRKLFQTGADGARTQLSESIFAYDDFGHPSDFRFSGGGTQWRSAYRNDADGDVLEETCLDADGHPVAGERGFAIRRQTYTRSAQGLRREETYFDAKGAKTYSKSGHHRLIDEFDSAGMLHRQTMEDHDPSRFKYYRLVTEPEYDEQGTMKRNVTRFELENGKLAADAGLAFTMSETLYDEKGREKMTWETGYSVADSGAPVWRRDIEWYATGVMQRRVWQAYNEDRQQLDTLPNTSYARSEEEFDVQGSLTRKLETGYAESRVGFHSRELRVALGQLQGVVLLKADGSELKDVRVLVHAILPDAQTATAQLHVGDQFLTANGVPVTNAYEWMINGNFAGGWIEVLRDGKRLRIEGFTKGPIGVLLEDRGPLATQ